MHASAPLDEVYGTAPADIPSIALDVEPGDVVLIDFDLFHASFHGGQRRRLITLGYGPSTSRMGDAVDDVVEALCRAADPDVTERILRNHRPR